MGVDHWWEATGGAIVGVISDSANGVWLCYLRLGSYPQQLSPVGMTYTCVVRLPNVREPEWRTRGWGNGDAGSATRCSQGKPAVYRQRMVMSRPVIMNAKPTAKFHGPSSAMNGILSPAR